MGDQWSLSRPRVTTGQMDIATLCLMFRKCSRLCSVSGCGLNYLDPTLTARSVGHWTRPSRGITSSEPPEILIKRDRISFKAPGGNAVNTHSIIMFLQKMAINFAQNIPDCAAVTAVMSGLRRETGDNGEMAEIIANL